MLRKLIEYVVFLPVLLEYVLGQVSPGPYPTTKFGEYTSYFRQPYGFEVIEGSQGPDYFSKIYAFPQYPPLLTPCQYMYPLSILIGNTNTTKGFSVEFECNNSGLNNSLSLNSSYGTLSFNSSTLLEGACSYIASFLNMAHFSVFQTNSFTNITYLIPGSIISHALSLIPSSNSLLVSSPGLEWLSNHYFGSSSINLPQYLNLAQSFDGTFSIPLLYKIYIPNDILPDVVIVGETSSRFYQDFFNLTITPGNSTSSNEDYNIIEWLPNTGYAGYLPSVFPVISIIPLLTYESWQATENNLVPWWGSSNIPLGISPLRIIPPSNLPSNGYNGCKSAFSFYYPSPIGQMSNSTKDSLNYLLNNSASSYYQRNTLQAMLFFNKIPYSMSGNIKGQLPNIILPYRMYLTNYIGGCYYNGTYPLVSTSDGPGFTAASLCYKDSLNTVPFNYSSFYPPPLNYSGYLTQPNHMMGITTFVSQFIAYQIQGGTPQNVANSLNPISAKYPGFGVSHATIYSIYPAGPQLKVKSPFNVYYNEAINIEFSRYALGQPYIWRLYGKFGVPGFGMSCRSPRYIPNLQEMDNLLVEWLCYTTNMTISQQQAATELKKYITHDCMVKSEIIKTCNSTLFKSLKSWSLSIPSGSYNEQGVLLFVQNITDLNFPKSYNTYKDSGLWFRSASFPSNIYNESWIPRSFCSSVPLLPVVPVQNPQILKLNSVVLPWDHFQDSIYSAYISLNGNSTVSVELSLAMNISLSGSTPVYIAAYALCQNIPTQSLAVVPSQVLLSEIQTYESIIITTHIPPLGETLRTSIDCYINIFASFNQVYSSKIGTFSSFGEGAPYTPPNGVAFYSYYVSVDAPPIMGSLSLFEPNPGNVTLTDSVFLSIDKIIYPSNSQSGAFPTVGILASSTPTILANSIVLLLGDSLQQVPQSIRLPAIVPIWYVFVRAQTFMNSGCSIPCSSEVSDSLFFSHWCTPENSKAYLCPKQKIEMSSNDSDEVILDAIAVALSPMTFYSLTDAYQLYIGLINQPVKQSIVWNDYFELLYYQLLQNQNIPYALDFAASKLQLLFILNKILMVSIENPQLKIDTISPLYILPNITLNSECTNNPGSKFLVLNTLDLLLTSNSPLGSTLEPSSLYISTIFRGVESVANRFSFWNGPGQSLNYTGKTSGIKVGITTTSFYTANSILNVGSMKFQYISKIDLKNLNLVNSYFFQLHPQFYNPSVVSSNCSSSSFTLSTTLLANDYIRKSLINLVSQIGNQYDKNIKKDSDSSAIEYSIPLGVYVGSSSLYLCSTDYHAFNTLQQVIFNLTIPTDNSLNLENLSCGALTQNGWSTSACRTMKSAQIGANNQNVAFFECACNAITDYALIGIPTIINLNNQVFGPFNPFTPSVNPPWNGFDGSLHNFAGNQTLVNELVNSSYSGFISIDSTTIGTSATDIDKSLLNNKRGISGIYTQDGREEKELFAVEWGIHGIQSLYYWNNETQLSSNNKNYIAWGPTTNNETNT
ncbi:hypothetical protein ACR3K2_09170 [Cryptosporidium serpentis]